MRNYWHNRREGVARRFTRPRRGVTLVELLVVISILGLLAITVIPNLTGTIDSRRSREATRGLSTFVARAQSRSLGAKEPKGFQIQPLSGDPAVAIDFFVADVPTAYAGEFISSTVTVGNGNAMQRQLVFSDQSTRDRLIQNGGFSTDGDSIQFSGTGPFYRFTPGVPPLVSMWSANNQNPFNTKLPNTGVPMPFRIRRQPKPSSVGVFQLTKGAALDIRWCSLGSELFSSFLTNSLNDAPITILFDTAGRPMQLVHSGGIRVTIGAPIFLLLGVAELCGNDAAPISDSNSEPETRVGANWQYVDATWLYIDHQSGLCRTAPSAARKANESGNVFDSQYNIRAAIGLGVRE